MLPLVYLRQVLKTTQNASITSDCINIVVLRVDDRQFGFVVDRINDTEEIVVKPVGKQLKGVNVFAGAIWIQGYYSAILDSKNQPCKVMLFATDTTATNSLLAELAEMRVRLLPKRWVATLPKPQREQVRLHRM